MADASTDNGRTRKPRVSDGLERAREAMAAALDEQWERFCAAIEDTDGTEPASCAVALKYTPGTDTRPEQIIVQGKASLPTSRTIFTARRAGGQIELLLAAE